MELECHVSPELKQKINRVGFLLTKRYGRQCTLAEALDAMAEVTLQKIDPVRKAERTAAAMATRRKAAKEEAPQPRPEPPKLEIPSHLKLAVFRRDMGQCTHRDTKRGRCERRKRLEVVPVASRGKASTFSVKDLITLCDTHYRVRFERQSLTER